MTDKAEQAGLMSRKAVFQMAGFALAAAAGCAKFPANGSGTGFTKVIFRLKVAGTINENYIYDFAIRASTDANPDTDPERIPQPVLNGSSPNGRMAGSPTHFVEYAPSNASLDPFTLYRFSTQAEVPNPSDPDNPINLGHYVPSTRGRIVNYDPITPGTTTNLQFELFVNLLADTDEQAIALQALQVQLLTMNRPATLGSGTRVIDYLGSSGAPEFIKVDLRSNGTYGNSSGFPGSGIEPTGDCPDPDLDIIDWTIEVQRP